MQSPARVGYPIAEQEHKGRSNPRKKSDALWRPLECPRVGTLREGFVILVMSAGLWPSVPCLHKWVCSNLFLHIGNTEMRCAAPSTLVQQVASSGWDFPRVILKMSAVRTSLSQLSDSETISNLNGE